MSEEQLSALLAKLKDDAGLREKLQGVGDLDGAVALAKEAGFDVSKADWLRFQAKRTLELSDEELEKVAGGGGNSQQIMSALKEVLNSMQENYSELFRTLDEASSILR